MRILFSLAGLFAALLIAQPSAQVGAGPSRTASAADRYWPQWRGPSANGISRTANPPVEWSEKKNVRWKVEVPGRGSSSPVVWGDRVFILTAIPAGAGLADSHRPLGGVAPRSVHRYVVMAFDRRDGRIAWERTAREEAPHEASHQDNGTWASASAITDGEHVIAPFESRGIYAYDMNGNLVWEKDLGDKSMRNEFGEGSTPVLYKNHLVIVWDHTKGSFITALDKRTGKELWRVSRNEIDTWATPYVVEDAGRAQVIVPGMNRLHSYDLETGAVVWHSQGLTMNPIPSPVGEDGMVIATSGFRGNNLKAIRITGAKGDLNGTNAIAWSLDRDTPYVPSPVLYDGFLYLLKSNSPILSLFDAKTGKPHYQLQRLDGLSEVFASPVGAAGRVYITGRDGTTLVIRNGGTFEVLARNVLDDGFDASPALVDNEIYMRGYRYLYSLGVR
jgi:outer membrane protein assembly factor BamB